MLHHHEKQQTADKCNYMDESQNHTAKWKEPHFVIPFFWNSWKGRIMYMRSRSVIACNWLGSGDWLPAVPRELSCVTLRVPVVGYGGLNLLKLILWTVHLKCVNFMVCKITSISCYNKQKVCIVIRFVLFLPR